jgi:hypothetical protein
VTGRLLALVALVAALAGGTVTAARIPGPTPLPAGGAISQVLLPATGGAAVPTCPGPETLVVPAGGQPGTLAGQVAVAGAVLDAVDSGPAGPAGTPAGTLGATSLVRPDSGIAVGSLVRAAAGPVPLQAARTASAPIVSAVQVGLSRTGDLRGLTALSCSAASTQTWLVGGGTQLGRRGRLLLANPAATPAVVDVSVHGPAGGLAPPAGSGVVVPAGRQVSLLVDALAPDLTAVAVRVQARTGRVAAALLDSYVRGLVPGGADEVTAAAPAARRQWVPGVSIAPPAGVPLPTDPAAPGAVVVRVVNPGSAPAVARVRLLGPTGPVVPVGSVLTVPPGAVRDLPLVDVPAGDYTAQVDADLPVLASALVGRTVSGGQLAGTPAGIGRPVPPSELAWAASVEPLTGTTVIALPTLTEAARRVAVGAVLHLGSAGRAVDVEVVEAGADGRPLAAARIVQVPADASVDLAVPAGAAAMQLRAAPGGAGGVVAAVVLQVQDAAGPMVAVLPVRPGPTGTAARPSAVADVRTGLS